MNRRSRKMDRIIRVKDVPEGRLIIPCIDNGNERSLTVTPLNSEDITDNVGALVDACIAAWHKAGKPMLIPPPQHQEQETKDG